MVQKQQEQTEFCKLARGSIPARSEAHCGAHRYWQYFYRLFIKLAARRK